MGILRIAPIRSMAGWLLICVCQLNSSQQIDTCLSSMKILSLACAWNAGKNGFVPRQERVNRALVQGNLVVFMGESTS